VDPERPGDFNQALMEYGAFICTPSQDNFSSTYDPLASVSKALKLRNLWTRVKARDIPKCLACKTRFLDVVDGLNATRANSNSNVEPNALSALFPLKKVCWQHAHRQRAS